MSPSVKNSVHQFGWKPVPHSVIRDEELRSEIHITGYAIKNWLSEEQVKELRNLWSDLHELAVEDGGIFYSVYSSDLEYRKQVHDRAAKIVSPVLDEHFQNYKNIINTFVAKTPGPNSEFYVHQDTSALDEHSHSALSVWIPLVDVGPENGGLSVIEKTQWLYSPYRAVTIPFPFHNYLEEVKPYLKPIEMKAGQVLVFDPRIIHSSGVNSSDHERVAMIAGIFPKDASFQHYFMDEGDKSKLDVYAQSEDFMLEYPNFFYDCHIRPTVGKVVNQLGNDFPEVTKEMFLQFCKENKIERPAKLNDMSRSPVNLVAEPDGINRPPACEVEAANEHEPETGFIGKIKKIFS